MQLAASFSTIKAGRAHFLKVGNFLKDKKDLYFQFDTGASVSLIGINTVCGSDKSKRAILTELLKNEIGKRNIPLLKDKPKTVTGEELNLYPCKTASVSIMQTPPIEMYFYCYLGNVNIPLLGNDFLEGCIYHHSLNGNIEIMSMSDENQSQFYPNDVIDFDYILDEYHKII